MLVELDEYQCEVIKGGMAEAVKQAEDEIVKLAASNQPIHQAVLIRSVFFSIYLKMEAALKP